MLDVRLIRLVRDSMGTAEGYCLQCGAFLSVTLPSDESALDAFSERFDEHLAKKHSHLTAEPT